LFWSGAQSRLRIFFIISATGFRFGTPEAFSDWWGDEQDPGCARVHDKFDALVEFTRSGDHGKVALLGRLSNSVGDGFLIGFGSELRLDDLRPQGTEVLQCPGLAAADELRVAHHIGD
jgi:hypothetical protein